MEDLISIGTIGLIKAVNTFCPQKHQAGHLRLPLHRKRDPHAPAQNQSHRNEISIDEPLNIDWDGNELLLSDILGTDPDSINRPIEDEAEKNLLLGAISHLDEREQLIMKLRFGLLGSEEKTQKEVADIIGISQSYISRLEKRIIKKLKKELEKTL
ncbi:MAG: sigma-70 family RNA polymerase sigma factor [Anaerotruncus massiliensis (ex Togo et al. 2019)]